MGPGKPPDHLIVTTTLDLPGCEGAHGLRLHPNGQSAFVACEGNDVLLRVDQSASGAFVTAKTGAGPAVLAIDADLGWLAWPPRAAISPCSISASRTS